jgi:hypothetical protein
MEGAVDPSLGSASPASLQPIEPRADFTQRSARTCCSCSLISSRLLADEAFGHKGGQRRDEPVPTNITAIALILPAVVRGSVAAAHGGDGRDGINRRTSASAVRYRHGG